MSIMHGKKETKMLENLGWMNSWKQDGEEYKLIKECREQGHSSSDTGDNYRCVSTSTCEECGYTYKIDSSG